MDCKIFGTFSPLPLHEWIEQNIINGVWGTYIKDLRKKNRLKNAFYIFEKYFLKYTDFLRITHKYRRWPTRPTMGTGTIYDFVKMLTN